MGGADSAAGDVVCAVGGADSAAGDVVCAVGGADSTAGDVVCAVDGADGVTGSTDIEEMVVNDIILHNSSGGIVDSIDVLYETQ